MAESQIELVSTLQNSIMSAAKNEEVQDDKKKKERPPAPIFKKKHLSRAIGPDGIVDMQEYLEKQHYEQLELKAKMALAKETTHELNSNQLPSFEQRESEAEKKEPGL